MRRLHHIEPCCCESQNAEGEAREEERRGEGNTEVPTCYGQLLCRSSPPPLHSASAVSAVVTIKRRHPKVQ